MSLAQMIQDAWNEQAKWLIVFRPLSWIYRGGFLLNKKAALGDLTTVCLPAFLLGVWHYVVVNRKDNQVGKDTYNQWCPLAGGGPRAYKGSMGKSITQEVSVYTNTNVADEVIIEDVEDGDPNDDIGSADDFSEQAQSTQGAYPVVNNNPLFIQQNGDGNVVMPNYGAITINFGKK